MGRLGAATARESGLRYTGVCAEARQGGGHYLGRDGALLPDVPDEVAAGRGYASAAWSAARRFISTFRRIRFRTRSANTRSWF